MLKKTLISLLILLSSTLAFAGEADVLGVKVNKNSDQSYHFDVTVKHKDEGWNHYVNKWDVVAPNGAVIATRILHHPHVNEQPFTRSLFSVKIPKNISRVTIRAYDSIHHYGGLEQDVVL